MSTIINRKDTAIIKEFADFIFSYIEDDDITNSLYALRLYFDKSNKKFYSELKDELKEWDALDFNRRVNKISIYEGKVADYVYGDNQSKKYLEALNKTNHHLLSMYTAYRQITGIYQNEYITIINFITDITDSYLLSDVADEAYKNLIEAKTKILHELAEKITSDFLLKATDEDITNCLMYFRSSKRN